MGHLDSFYPGDRIVELVLVTVLVVALTSSVAWLAARHMLNRPALRHLVLFWALVCTLVTPAIACFCWTSNFAVVTLPILVEQPVSVAPVAVPIHEHPVGLRPVAPANVSTVVVDDTSDAPPAALEDNSQLESPSTVPAPVERFTFHGAFTAIFIAWFLGSLALMTRLVHNCVRVIRLRVGAQTVADERLAQLAADAVDRLGARCQPRLLASRHCAVPLAVGLGPAVVILPEKLSRVIDDKDLSNVLLHEIAHLARGDQWTVLVESFAIALYWPIISMHALVRSLRQAREDVCDNVVLNSRGAVQYGHSLLRVAEHSLDVGSPHVAVGMFGRHGELERRIASLLDPRRSTLAKTRRRTVCLVMLLFLLGIGTASSTRLIGQSPQPVDSPMEEESESHAEAAQTNHDQLQSIGRFSGTVAGPDDHPLAGARIYVVPSKRESDDPGPVRAITGKDGKFDFTAEDFVYNDVDGLPTRRPCTIVAIADGFGFDWVTLKEGRRLPTPGQEVSKGTVATGLKLQLPADDVPIHGRLLAPDGEPLVGAEVNVYSINIPKNYDLDAHLRKVEEMRPKRAVPFMNQPQYEKMIHKIPAVNGVTVATQSGADGRYTLRGLGKDRLVSLMITAPGMINDYVSTMTRFTETPSAEADDADSRPRSVRLSKGSYFTRKLEAGLTISGVVRDQYTKKPIVGMWVRLRKGPETRKSLTKKDFPYVTDQQGRFTITGHYPSNKPISIVAAAGPGVPYRTGEADVVPGDETVVECLPGVPFRLKVVDETGAAVTNASVSYSSLWPNPHFTGRSPVDHHWPKSRAAHRGNGIYEGHVLQRAGAVLVKMPVGSDYLPARVDPKAFFLPGWPDAPIEEKYPLYGTKDTLSIGPFSSRDQSAYAAIVLVNPTDNWPGLELTSTVRRIAPRLVHLIDPDGKPVVGAQVRFTRYKSRTLRGSSFTLRNLHPDRLRKMIVIHEERGLIGYVMADGGGTEPYTVRMYPWASINGRLVGEDGQPLPIHRPESDFQSAPSVAVDLFQDHQATEYGKCDGAGKFRVDHLIPGQTYKITAYFQPGTGVGNETVLESLVMGAGEDRDLGDLKTSLSFTPNYIRSTVHKQLALANIPDQSWGEPIDGLRAAIVPHTQPIDENEMFNYDLVIENVSDREIRSTEFRKFKYGVTELSVFDTTGSALPFQPGTPPKHGSVGSLKRYQLKPGERISMQPRRIQLVKLDEQGQPTPEAPPIDWDRVPISSEAAQTKNLPNREWKKNGYFETPAGQYSVGAEFELGKLHEHVCTITGKVTVRSPLEGEWIGHMKTGTAEFSVVVDDTP